MVELTEEMEKTMNLQYKKVIFAYLKGRVAEDETLAEAIKKDNKSIDGVIAYIKAEARKQAQGNVAVIPDEEVFGWAVHYILEDELNYEGSAKNEDRKTTAERKETGSENKESDFEDDGEELEEDRKENTTAPAEKNKNNKTAVRKTEKPKSIEEQMQDFYAESELFRGL